MAAAHPVIAFATETANAWRAEVERLNRRGLIGAAGVVESLAAELEERAARFLERAVTLAEAAEISGLAYSSLQHLVASGELPNAGRRGRPRVRRGDLPHGRTAPTAARDFEGDLKDLEDHLLLDLER